MKLLTRIKISYVIAFICPVVLILATVFGVMKMGLNSMEQKYDLDQSSYEMILNPMSMLGHMTASTVEELEQVMKDDPDKLLDQAYLEKLNERLSNHSSYLLVKKDWQNIYSGLPAEGNYKDDFNYSPKDGKDESIYIVDEQPYHIQQMNFAFSDGTAGQALIYTNVAQIIPQMKKLVEIIITSLLILFAGSFIAMFWLYQSIVRPLNKLKTAAENIKDGNLNFSVAAETDDEIGEVCVAFEEMRLKLKGQIERNIQYEKESKELISNISHDLKTPMTAIKGYIEGIMDGVADTEEKRNRYIRTIYNKVNDMNSLIEELFLYAKLDSNSVTYSFAKVNVDAYFQDCVEEISLDLESQGVDFGYFNYADRDTVIIADPEQLKRVVNNIIGNSVKYASPDRKLMISLRIMEEAEFVKIEIEDNGKGIARNEVPLIFDRCYRTDASRNSSKGGSGLGLSIAKKIIEEHGGKIWAVSTEGVGTTMCFVLRKYKENNVYE
ncbi:MAG: sensor histidine kinase [Coprococcus sp.]